MRTLAVFVAVPLALVSLQQVSAPVMSCESITNRTSLSEVQQRTGDAPERFAVTWADAQQTRMAALWTTDRKSVWRSSNGIRVGMPIAEVDQLNERSFELRGFETDDPGQVVSWAGGTLEPPSAGSCRLVVRLAPTVFEFNTLDWRLIEPIQFSDIVQSDEKRIKPYKAVVSAIGLSWR